MRNYLKTEVDFIDQERSLFAPGCISIFRGITKTGFRRLFASPSLFILMKNSVSCRTTADLAVPETHAIGTTGIFFGNQEEQVSTASILDLTHAMLSELIGLQAGKVV
jgi:hypothetical protein